MKVYWTLESIPELAPLPPPERGRVWNVCVSRSFTHWQPWGGILLLFICTYAPAWTLYTLLVGHGVRALVAFLVTTPLAAGGFLLGVGVLRQIIIPRIRPCLRAYSEHAYGALPPGDPPHPAAGSDDTRGRRS